jgi:oligopeptide/dipeptide ABC transporter ATP-binding protein
MKSVENASVKTLAVQSEDLVRRFRVHGGRLFSPRKFLHAVDGVSISVPPGKTLGIVGESGCGKSTLGRLLVGLDSPDSGSVLWAGKPAGKHDGRVQAVFQDPASALDPHQKVMHAIAEPLRGLKKADRSARVREVADLVGLSEELLHRYPHELSGGQQQRVCIARAVAPNPDFILLDEAVSSLDASLQMQVVDLLRRLQDEIGSAFAFISHDLRVVRALSDQIAVMYLGEVVELAPAHCFETELLHPYSVVLRSAEPALPTDAVQVNRILIGGDPPSAIDLPPGCRFASRCPVAQEVCRGVAPPLAELAPGHLVRCHFPGSLKLQARDQAQAGSR